MLRYYTPVNSYYRLVKTVEADPEFDTKSAKKKLCHYVESHDHAIKLKAEIMVDHFHEQVLALNKIGGQARAMVVTSGIERAIQYFQAISAYLVERKSPYRAIVAFSGEHEFGGAKVTEGSLNGFPSKDIVDKIQDDPYRFLICADKFQTGYDRAAAAYDVCGQGTFGHQSGADSIASQSCASAEVRFFVLDFMNDTETIRALSTSFIGRQF